MIRALKKLVRRGQVKESGPRKDEYQVLDKLAPPYKEALLSLYRLEPQRGLDGQLHTTDNRTRISPAQGMWLYDFCLSKKPEKTLEIGLAYGFSTLYILAAAKNNNKGHHTAIDPFARGYWKGIGLVHATDQDPTLGGASSFRFIEDRSDRAAADLAREGRDYDLIFIDGNHRFDDVLVDFYLYAQLCSVGGFIVFDDMWMSSIQSVVGFIRSNRADFSEVNVDQKNVAVFQRNGEDKRNWNEFVKFKVSKSAKGS
jgi:predicted O-methyltransferase YrrM